MDYCLSYSSHVFFIIMSLLIHIAFFRSFILNSAWKFVFVNQCCFTTWTALRFTILNSFSFWPNPHKRAIIFSFRNPSASLFHTPSILTNNRFPRGLSFSWCGRRAPWSSACSNRRGICSSSCTGVPWLLRGRGSRRRMSVGGEEERRVSSLIRQRS